MLKIEKVSWAKVKINNQTYHQALLIGEKILERDKDKLETLFRTTHEIGDWEQKELLSGQPSVILIVLSRCDSSSEGSNLFVRR